jgi:subtilase family protein
MHPKALGARRIDSWIKRPIDLYRLQGRTYSLTRKPVETNLPLRVLVKVAAKTSQTTLVKRLLDAFSLPEERRDTLRVGGRTRVRPLGRTLRDGTRWYVVELPVQLGSYLDEVGYDRKRMAELTSALEAIDGVLLAELDLPSENLVRPLQESIPGCTAGRDVAPADVDWAPRLVGLFDLPANGPNGAGVRIGHLDTGFTQHPELDVDEAYDLAASTSTIDAGGGLDPMPGGTSHGTATASVITSRPNTQATNDLDQPSPGVTGLATGATIVAARTLDGVVVSEIPLFVPSSIASAVLHCIDEGVHVITMSFGGLVSAAVKDALQEAYQEDIILVAAAGNCVGFVVEPASFSEVIACGGVGIDPATGAVHPWPGTSHGLEVDISAPSENVWIADWINGVALVKPGEGTSFAAPHVAAAAAIWLDRHGRETLLEQYGGSSARLCDVFREVARRSALVPPDWDTSENGAGVINLPGLIAQALPDPLDVTVPEPDAGLIQLIPTVTGPVKVVVDINKLEVKDDGEFFGGAEPYVMLCFFTVDGDTARMEANLDVSHPNLSPATLQVQLLRDDGEDSIVYMHRRGRHGNVREVNIGPIELADREGRPRIRRIHNDVGRYAATIEPIPVHLFFDAGDVVAGIEIEGFPPFIGVHAILAEEDSTTNAAAIEGHEVIADGLREILEGVLQDLDLSDISIDPDSFTERYRELEDEARDAANETMNWWDVFWGGIVDPDDRLIQVFKMVNVMQLQQEGTVAVTDHKVGPHGDWRIRGEIRLDED